MSTEPARILLVDDEEFLLDLVREILEEAGYNVTALTNSTVAFQTFSQAPSSFDLVISDERMPNLSGTGLSEQILGIRPDVPVILFTDYLDAKSAKRAHAIGVRAIIGKSLNMRELIAYVRRFLNT